MEQLIGDNLVACADVPPIERKVDLMKVRALPYRQDGTGKVYWVATVGGKKYGPLENVDTIFKAVERDVRDAIGAGYRVGGASD